MPAFLHSAFPEAAPDSAGLLSPARSQPPTHPGERAGVPAGRALLARARRLPQRGVIAHVAFVAAVALMVSLGTGVWDAPAPASTPAALVRAAAHLAPQDELPVVPGPPMPTAIENVPPPTATSASTHAGTPRSTATSHRVHQASISAPDPSVSAFVPVYQLAGQTFGVNWMLIASIHDQETSFSRDPTTYHGLNYAGCCGGPMQFNVTNGPVSTWSLVSDAYRYAPRPASYPHQTQTHPSIYDDFDAIMAAARLLQSNGATGDLGAASWQAAYSYYGHDAFGVTYADQVLARAIMWSQQGFCPDCSVDPALVSAVHAAYAPGGSGQLASFGSAASHRPAPASRRSPRRPAPRPARKRSRHQSRRSAHGRPHDRPRHTTSPAHPGGGAAFQPSSGRAGGTAAG